MLCYLTVGVIEIIIGLFLFAICLIYNLTGMIPCFLAFICILTITSAGVFRWYIFCSFNEKINNIVILKFRNFYDFYIIKPKKYRIQRFCVDYAADCWNDEFHYVGDLYKIIFVSVFDYIKYWMFIYTSFNKKNKNKNTIRYLESVQKDIESVKTDSRAKIINAVEDSNRIELRF